MFEPKGNMILVEQIPVEMKTAGGIITGLGDEEKRQQMGQRVGIVREMGADAYKSETGFTGSDAYCEVGDVILFPRYSGTQFQISEIMNEPKKDGEVHFHLMPDTDVMAVMSGDLAVKYKQQRGLEA